MCVLYVHAFHILCFYLTCFSFTTSFPSMLEKLIYLVIISGMKLCASALICEFAS